MPLTKQEQMIVALLIFLLLTGWAVKNYRAAHPRTRSEEKTRP